MIETIHTWRAQVPRKLGYVGMGIGAVLLAASAVVLHPLVPLVVIALFFWLFWSLRNPFVLLLTYAAFNLLRLMEIFPMLGAVSAGKILIGLTIVIFILSKMLSRDYTLAKSPHTTWFVVLLVAVTVSTYRGTDIAHSLSWLTGSYIKIFIFYLLILNVVNTEKRAVIFQFGLASITTLMALYALTAKFLGFDPVTGSPLIEGSRAALVGALGDPNDLALTLLLSIHFLSIGSIELRGPRRMVCLVMLFIVIGGLLVTQSRGGLLGFLAGSAIVAGYYIRNKVLWVASLALLFAVLFFASGISERAVGGDIITQGLDESAASRLDTWEAAILMFIDRPLTGVGFQCFAQNHFLYSTISHAWWETPTVTHNAYLQALSETGLVGFIPFMMMLYLSLRGAMRLKNAASEKTTSLTYVVKRSTLPNAVGVWGASFFLSQAWFAGINIIHAVIAASVLVFHIGQNEDETDKQPPSG